MTLGSSLHWQHLSAWKFATSWHTHTHTHLSHAHLGTSEVLGILEVCVTQEISQRECKTNRSLLHSQILEILNWAQFQFPSHFCLFLHWVFKCDKHCLLNDNNKKITRHIQRHFLKQSLEASKGRSEFRRTNWEVKDTNQVDVSPDVVYVEDEDGRQRSPHLTEWSHPSGCGRNSNVSLAPSQNPHLTENVPGDAQTSCSSSSHIHHFVLPAFGPQSQKPWACLLNWGGG